MRAVDPHGPEAAQRKGLIAFRDAAGPWLDAAEALLHERWAGEPPAPPVFIIGAPRTGSTILYQCLTGCWDFEYVSNVECIFHRHLLFAARLRRALCGDGPHGCFTSCYGETPGLDGPAECGPLWYRWFPQSRHSITTMDVGADVPAQMRGVLSAWLRCKARPVLFKNMLMGLRLRVLALAFPEALFLWCRRDTARTARSLLRARRELADGRWWSMRPAEYERLLSLPPEEQVVGQVVHVEREIADGLERLYPGRSMVLEYERFCAGPERELERVRRWLAGFGVDVRRREGAPLPPIAESSAPQDDPVLMRLQRLAGKEADAVRESPTAD